jgi:hypothetical protein
MAHVNKLERRKRRLRLDDASGLRLGSGEQCADHGRAEDDWAVRHFIASPEFIGWLLAHSVTEQ